MKTVIIVLGFIIYFTFKFFKNYKAEMDKAKARAVLQDKFKAKENTTSPEMFNARAHLESIKDEAIQRKNVFDVSRNKKASLDYYNPEIPAEEVKTGRLIHEPHHHGLKKVEEEEKPIFHFDLRQAIIQEAVLNRPKY